jgi:hypothetical protein
MSERGHSSRTTRAFQDKEEADIILVAAKLPTDTPEEREERRAGVEVCSAVFFMASHIMPLSNILKSQVDSAMIVHREGVCLGIKTPEATFFSFREMTVRVDEAREAVIVESSRSTS